MATARSGKQNVEPIQKRSTQQAKYPSPPPSPSKQRAKQGKDTQGTQINASSNNSVELNSGPSGRGRLASANESAEGFGSDNNITEPLDHAKDLLDELDSKILEKYRLELEEVEECHLSTFKLKA